MKTKTLAVVAANVARLRADAGWTQTVLSRKAGISQRSVSGLEQQQKAPTLDTLTGLAEAFKVPPWMLLLPVLPAADEAPGLERLVTLYLAMPAVHRGAVVQAAEMAAPYRVTPAAPETRTA